MRPVLLLLAVAWLPALAADPIPEISREPATAQAVGAAHTVRTIPEACARLEGMFTGDAAKPYTFAAVRTSANCQPRARLVDADKAEPSEQAGWKLNDLIRIPNAACTTQVAEVRIWRMPVEVTSPELDGQGQARIYLDDQRATLAAAGKSSAVAMFAAQLSVQGERCVNRAASKE